MTDDKNKVRYLARMFMIQDGLAATGCVAPEPFPNNRVEHILAHQGEEAQHKAKRRYRKVKRALRKKEQDCIAPPNTPKPSPTEHEKFLSATMVKKHYLNKAKKALDDG